MASSNGKNKEFFLLLRSRDTSVGVLMRSHLQKEGWCQSAVRVVAEGTLTPTEGGLGEGRRRPLLYCTLSAVA